MQVQRRMRMRTRALGLTQGPLRHDVARQAGPRKAPQARGIESLDTSRHIEPTQIAQLEAGATLGQGAAPLEAKRTQVKPLGSTGQIEAHAQVAIDQLAAGIKPDTIGRHLYAPGQPARVEGAPEPRKIDGPCLHIRLDLPATPDQPPGEATGRAQIERPHLGTGIVAPGLDIGVETRHRHALPVERAWHRIAGAEVTGKALVGPQVALHQKIDARLRQLGPQRMRIDAACTQLNLFDKGHCKRVHPCATVQPGRPEGELRLHAHVLEAPGDRQRRLIGEPRWGSGRVRRYSRSNAARTGLEVQGKRARRGNLALHRNVETADMQPLDGSAMPGTIERPSAGERRDPQRGIALAHHEFIECDALDGDLHRQAQCGR